MRIVIVEDEQQIRTGLCTLVERIHPEYHVVGSACNGRTGLACVKTLQPDVVITDVRMPDIDGLEMIEALHTEGITPHYIIISAYSEFSYAKKAISFGVTEYLLKPISIEELDQALKKADLQLQFSNLNKQAESPESAIKTLFLNGNGADQQFMKNSSQYCLDELMPFAMVLLYFGDAYEALSDSANLQLIQNFQKKCTYVYSVPFKTRRANLFLLSGIADRTQLLKWLNDSVKLHQHDLWQSADICLAFCEDLELIYPTAMAMLNAMSWKISLPCTLVLQYPEVLQTQTAHCSFPIDIENQLRVAICTRNAEKISALFSRFLNYYSGQIIYSPHDIKESYTRFCLTALNLAKEMGFDQTEQLQTSRMMEHILSAQNLRELNAVAEHLYNTLIDHISNSSVSENNITIIRTKSLVRELYSSGITLEEIAQKLSITPEYLSTQFRNQTNETFSTYIRNYRITKAKGLLITTDLKIYEIAKLVGYSDAKYFGQVFKRCTGQLPADYRRSHK